MQGNSIISDVAQTYLEWVDGEDSGSVGYLGKAYNQGKDSNPAVTIKELGDDAGTIVVEYHTTDAIPALTLTDSTLHLAKVAAENALVENGNLDFSVTGPETLTGLNEDGTTLEFSVKSTSAWTFTSSVAWATANTNSGTSAATVTVTIADNAGAARTGTLTFSNGVVTKTFAIGQAINA